MKKTYYYVAMDECQTAIIDAINRKRSSAEHYRNSEIHKDAETGKPNAWAEEQANEYDAIANEMERIMGSIFNI